MRKGIWSLCIAVLIGAAAPEASGQEAPSKWRLGGFANLYVPISNFRQMYAEGAKFGGSIEYAFDNRRRVEIEYHHARFSDGKMESRDLLVGSLTSPNAKSDMTFNGLAANWLFAIHEEGFGQNASPYLTVGVGYYDYSSKVSGLVFPEDTSLEIEPSNDTRTAASANFGGGVQIALGSKVALDLRARYNLVVGELRPFLAWGVEHTFPFSLIDIGAGLKISLPE